MSLITIGVSERVTKFALGHGFCNPVDFLELAELEEMSPSTSFYSDGGELIDDLPQVAAEIGISQGAIVRALDIQGYHRDLSALRAGKFNLGLTI